MLCDAHVHMGYYARKGWREPFYYSPRRVLGVLDRCGVEEFIVSSTCAQIDELGIDAIVREAREVKRLAGQRAHVFFWLSGHLYDEDHEMKWLDDGLFEGLKFHEWETPWMQNRREDLRRILGIASSRQLPVMFHSGESKGCVPFELAEIAKEFPSVHFLFAHCRPMGEMSKVMEKCPNVWTDTAYMPLEDFSLLSDYDWQGRLLWGTDLPVWQANEDCGLTKRYREYVKASSLAGLSEQYRNAFNDFMNQPEERERFPKR